MIEQVMPGKDGDRTNMDTCQNTVAAKTQPTAHNDDAAAYIVFMYASGYPYIAAYT